VCETVSNLIDLFLAVIVRCLFVALLALIFAFIVISIV
jgi:hypothetical protein